LILQEKAERHLLFELCLMNNPGHRLWQCCPCQPERKERILWKAIARDRGTALAEKQEGIGIDMLRYLVIVVFTS
jgi:hypothetical protein